MINDEERDLNADHYTGDEINSYTGHAVGCPCGGCEVAGSLVRPSVAKAILPKRWVRGSVPGSLVAAPAGPSQGKTAHRATLPEMCMDLHMEHTGSCQDMSREEYAAAVEHVRSRVASWHVPTDMFSGPFDAAIYALCVAVLAEADRRARDGLGPAGPAAVMAKPALYDPPVGQPGTSLWFSIQTVMIAGVACAGFRVEQRNFRDGLPWYRVVSNSGLLMAEGQHREAVERAALEAIRKLPKAAGGGA